MNVVLAEPLGHHAERLKHKNKRAVIVDRFSNRNTDRDERRSKIDYRDFFLIQRYYLRIIYVLQNT